MKSIRILGLAGAATGIGAVVYQPKADLTDIPNRVPEPPPYVTDEGDSFAPPFEDLWRGHNHPGQCKNCHRKIFDQWNGSMMSNSWRDPVWRAAFLLLSREVSTHGECDVPDPPDGTPKAKHNPFAKPGTCESRFDIGNGLYTVSRPGSLLDGFCSRCHMPTNYIDNIPFRNVSFDPKTGIENGKVDPKFNPTSDDGTGIAFATVDSQFRNTDSGRTGIFCAVCHSMAATRETPFHTYRRSGAEYHAATAMQPRSDALPIGKQDMFQVADPNERNLGYGIGAGAYRLSPHAIGNAERFGPLAAGDPPSAVDTNTSKVFGADVPYQHMDASKHQGFYQAMFVRSEMCGTCHDVTNALPLKNKLGQWIGGFPIERTYTEWANSRYAERPGNAYYDPHFKRDCQSCHMQQDYGQPGTAQTLYENGRPLPIPSAPVVNDGKPRPFFTHHFVGGNTLVPRLIGKDVDDSGNPSPWPELSYSSFSSSDHNSPYSRAYWTHLERKGAYAQQARMAWDRLRHALSMDVTAPASASAGVTVPIAITIANTGSGHDFPTGFPEGRTAWVAVHAYDLATGRELAIHDSVWNRDSVGVGDLTTEEMVDPNFPNCNWKLPAGSADPYSIQLKAIASLGDGCPTLDLPYAAPLNLVTNKDGLPVDESGRVVGASNPTGLVQFKDKDGDGDLFDDAFLRDWRLRPMPHPDATRKIDRYSIVVPPGTRGPIAVSSAVYYQSVEAVVALKFLGNMADTNNDFVLQPCVLGGLCDGRTPSTEPPVVEGAPPVPMVVRTAVVAVESQPPPNAPLLYRTYPAANAANAYQDTVVKVFFSAPAVGVSAESFTLEDEQGARVPASVEQIGAAAWGLFPNAILLKPGATYTARLKAGICDPFGHCTPRPFTWTFTVASDAAKATGDTSVPRGF